MNSGGLVDFTDYYRRNLMKCSVVLLNFFCAVQHRGAVSQNLSSNNEEAPEGSDCLCPAQQPDHSSVSHRPNHTVLDQVSSVPCSTIVPCGTTTLAVPDMLQCVQSAQQTLISKLQWATQELEGTNSVEYSTQLCQLVKECADAIKSMRDIT